MFCRIVSTDSGKDTNQGHKMRQPPTTCGGLGGGGGVEECLHCSLHFLAICALEVNSQLTVLKKKGEEEEKQEEEEKEEEEERKKK